MSNTACRCSSCRTRRSLKRNPDQYIRVPKCIKCGGTLVVDKYRMNTERKRKPCNCSGYMFPHRLGSKYCLYAKEPTTPELELEKDQQAALMRLNESKH